MKCSRISMTVVPVVSHPARGAWIEISAVMPADNLSLCRTPQGVRGLKSTGRSVAIIELKSHPARGAWIEIFISRTLPRVFAVAPRKGCVD